MSVKEYDNNFFWSVYWDEAVGLYVLQKGDQRGLEFDDKPTAVRVCERQNKTLMAKMVKTV